MPALLIESQRVAHTVAHGTHGRRRAGPGETFWQFRHFDHNDARSPASIGGARRAPTICSCASANGRPRIPSGCGSISRPRCGSARRCRRCHQGKPRRGARRLRSPSCSRVAASASACSAAGPSPAAPPPAASPRSLMGDTSEASLPPNAKLSRFSECLLFSDFLEPVADTAERLEDDRGAGRARPSRSGARSRRGDAALRRPHRVRRERRPRPGDRRPRRDLARALPGPAQAPPHRSLELTQRLGWSFLVHHTDRPPEEAVLACITGSRGSSGITAIARRGTAPVARRKRVSSHDDHRRDRLSSALGARGAGRASRHLVAVAADPAKRRSSWCSRRRGC